MVTEVFIVDEVTSVVVDEDFVVESIELVKSVCGRVTNSVDVDVVLMLEFVYKKNCPF